MSEETGRRGTAGADAPGTAHEERAVDLAQRLFEHARAGRTEALCAWLDHGLPVDAADAEGSTLLALAASHGHVETVEALLSRTADPDRADNRGRTALGMAVLNDRQDVVTALVRAGADPYRGSPSAEESARFLGRPDLLMAIGIDDDDPLSPGRG
ncbi:ankyrin repeat domain-containing protein [Kineococcus gynurae]|uniref:Ankyrin repeat domain-containing protein n=1 Tax=Kineococcus gynurae TaxID=452979 RepID=A0ABV5LPZ7_9ACTN